VALRRNQIGKNYMTITIADAITAISVAFAAYAVIKGINAWEREFIGKRRIELAETVLALFYEAQDAIRNIRLRVSFAGEGETRKRSESETEAEAEFLDRTYVVFERYQKKEKLFAELRSMKYRVMATFGSDAGEPFDELNQTVNEIFLAADILRTHYWQKQEQVGMNKDEFQEHLKETRRYEAVLWSKGNEKDEISLRVQHAVEKIESIAREASLAKALWFNKGNRKSKNRA
jgi:hypothetical protein